MPGQVGYYKMNLQQHFDSKIIRMIDHSWILANRHTLSKLYLISEYQAVEIKKMVPLTGFLQNYEE